MFKKQIKTTREERTQAAKKSVDFRQAFNFSRTELAKKLKCSANMIALIEREQGVSGRLIKAILALKLPS